MNNFNKGTFKQNNLETGVDSPINLDSKVTVKSTSTVFLKRGAGSLDFIKKQSTAFLLFISLICHVHFSYSTHHHHEPKKLTYYLYISDFVNSFIEIPTSNVSGEGTTIASSYLAGRAPLYDKHNTKVGVCSASFLNMQTPDGIFTDISNYISINDNGLIVTWFTPTTLINLELDSIIHSMVTECIVKVTTKVGFAPYYGETFNLVVSSDDEKIYFKFTKIKQHKKSRAIPSDDAVEQQEIL